MTATGLPDAPRATTPYSSPQGTWRPDPHRSARRPLASQLRTRSQRTGLRDDHQTAVSCARLEPHRREPGVANPSPGSPFAAAFSMSFYSSVMKFDPQGHRYGTRRATVVAVSVVIWEWRAAAEYSHRPRALTLKHAFVEAVRCRHENMMFCVTYLTREVLLYIWGPSVNGGSRWTQSLHA